MIWNKTIRGTYPGNPLKTARNTEKAVYEKNFGIWMTDLVTGDSGPVHIDSPNETRDNNTFFVENGDVSDYSISPDNKKIAAVVRGEIFVMSTDGGYARNITNSSWRERDIDWDGDSKNIVFVSDEGANPNIYIISALGDNEPARLTNTEEDVLNPIFSPDGKLIAYYQGKRQIRLMQPDGRNNRMLIEDDFGGRFSDLFSWSPDSKYLAVVTGGFGAQSIIAVNIENGNKIKLTDTAYDETSPAWSADGKTLFFSSNRFGHSFPEFTGKWDIYRVFLEPQRHEFDEDEFENLFIEKKEEEKENDVQIRFKMDNIELQTERIANTQGDEQFPIISSDDANTVYFTSDMDGKRHLWKSEYKDGKWSDHESFMPGVTNLRNLQFDSEGKYLYYVRNGKIGKINVKSAKSESVSFSSKIEVEKISDYEQMLGELYYVFQNYYYDEHHHNVDWKKLYEQYLPVLQQVREDQDFYDYANEMIGYLNSSHTGMRARATRQTEKPSAHLGVIWDFSGNRIKIGKILKNGPAYFFRDSVSVGDEIVLINGEPVESSSNIWRQLNGNLDKRIKVTLNSAVKSGTLHISLKPITARAETQLILDEWVESRREIVKNETGDKTAYIHMAAMGRRDLDKFLLELERDAVPRDGLILDLRYNFGGNVHDRVLEALMKPVYAKWKIRGLSESQQSTFGFADKPVILLINEVTLSDGEMTANGFKELKRGKIIGNTTYGWLIFTTGNSLMNGNYFRLPFWGCYTLDGQDLETSGGVTPDIEVINDLNHDIKNLDPQLDRAIEEIKKMMRK